MEMIECSVKTKLNGKPFIYRYGILVDEFEGVQASVYSSRSNGRTGKRGRG
jgi:hypothetical protein